MKDLTSAFLEEALPSPPADMNPAGLPSQRVGLTTERYGRTLRFLEETDSTNDDARVAAADGAPDGFTIVADRQRRGRGARGRTWSSPPGTDLYLSMVARRLPTDIAALPPLTLAVGLAVADTVAALAPAADVRVKWPNDVWVNDRKCAGILVETVTQGARVDAVIIGIGLNVNRDRFDGPLAETATSLARVTQRSYARAEVLATLLVNLERQVDRFTADGLGAIITDVTPRLAFLGETVATEDTHGVLRGIHPDGSLHLERDGEVVAVRSGTLRRA